ncbi:hypothetical protein HOU70_gp48 [Arthrobacter phage Liebe]|uniref:Uncharacterized protein n=2 Tax=Arthrobacter virus Liebe TaxID=2734245 RepID=A0A3G2KHS5_9CAUD|nr:hypothetical protein HOU70_gp48 [Arthrobacter phage Liebe]AYN58529.1 hypothetical protein PBI_MAUREEN_48 [Arthrobacter phage Maureen]AZF93781.1 hypothetical protein PBI_LIEBE_48 [Arthrobacter phage Liebe]
MTRTIPTAAATIRQIAPTVDAALAELWWQESKAMATVAGLAKELARLAPGAYRSARESAMAEAQAELEAIRAEGRPLEEIAKAAKWTRFVLVPGGHLHRGFYCPTLRATTRTGLMPEYSGADEAEVVDLAGEVACTVCFPSAPVDRPTRIPSLVAEREAREAAAAEKAAAKVAAQAAQITVGKDVFKSQRAAENAISWEIESVVSRRYMEARDAEHRAYLDDLAAQDLHNARRIAAAIEAQVPGYSAQDVLTKKFQAKVRQYRKGGWDIPENACL